MIKTFSWTEPVFLLILGLISIYVSVLSPGIWLLHHRSVDLPSYYVAGYMVLKDANPYHPDEIITMAYQVDLTEPIFPYIYFPLVAVLFIPLSMIRYQTVQILWYYISQIFFLFSIVFLYRITRRCYSSDSPVFLKRFFYLIPITCLSFPLISNFRHGQINTIILFFVCAFLYFLMTNSEILAGFALALVLSIKPQPAFILPYLLLKKRFKCAASTIISFIIITGLTVFVVGSRNFLFYLTNILPSFGLTQSEFQRIFIYWPGNHSLQGFVSRLFLTTMDSFSLWEKPDLITWVSYILLLTVIAISFFRLHTWSRNKPTTDRMLLRDCSYLLILSIMASPITWDHHLVLIFPLAAFLLFEKPNKFWKSLAGITILFCWIIMANDLYLVHPFWTMNKITSLGMSIKMFAILGFWGLISIYGQNTS